MSRGAAGYLTKAADRDTILDALAAAARGEVQMPSEIQTELIGELRRHVASDRPRPDGRSRRRVD